MTREDKKALVDELVEKFKQTDYFYITDSSKLSVAQTNTLRELCFEKGVEYRVVKNTLIKKALEALDNGADYSEFDDEVLKGFSGIMFSSEIGNLPAKVILDFRKKVPREDKKPILKGASIDSALYIGNDHVDALSKLKSKDELLSDVLTLLQSPAKNVISALSSSGGDKIAGLVKALSEREG